MINVAVRIEGLDRLRANFSRAPQIALRYLSQATKAAIFEVEKQATDANFQFKTPRSLRTGFLALSFAYGRSFSQGGLRGSIGPTAHYAPYVYFGTRRGMKANRYMDRIASAADRYIGKHFETAVDRYISEIAKV